MKSTQIHFRTFLFLIRSNSKKKKLYKKIRDLVELAWDIYEFMLFKNEQNL